MPVLVRTLANGVQLPAVMLGSWQLKPEEAEASVGTALRSGYRGVDDAFVYKNEEAVGKVVQEFDGKFGEPCPELIATADSKVISDEEFQQSFSVPHGKPGDDRKVFVTSKIWVTAFDEEPMAKQLDEHLKNFNRTSADLLILHWPGEHPDFGVKSAEHDKMMEKINSHEYRIQTWKNMEKLYAQKKVRAIGVSNYLLYHLKPIVEDVLRRQKEGDKNAVLPMYNQIEISPLLQPASELIQFCKEHKIVIASYSTMGGKKGIDTVTSKPELAAIAKRHNKTVNQIILRWAMQREFHIIPKSKTPTRVTHNLGCLSFGLSKEDVQEIDKLDQHIIMCLDPMEIQ